MSQVKPKAVLDASAVLALLLEEDGGADVTPFLDDAVVSTVNWSEVAQKLVREGRNVDADRGSLEAAGVGVVSFASIDANLTARLHKQVEAQTPRRISLADRACLALAQRAGCPAVTCDAAWAELQLDPHIDVVLIERDNQRRRFRRR